ncbi:hypothetical protein MO867_17890 [Microbulbifer sp. OS29]|uniref:Uncharacterized protein n=1 Tax=Microbulbifer okhotskensis TaxID=2926617 RepID=A0A9X2ER08_9GAMM|nr:hypothetical protein [Microbulbifer okhotskensis]MCO1336205.1 hypothetical protein [Microbulbifer okhotskensis]
MKARQYKKLCKKARTLLIALGESAFKFYEEYDYVMDCGHLKSAYVWGVYEAPDYFGESEWYSAWNLLDQRVADETANWGPEEQNPYRTSIKGTIRVLSYARTLAELKNAQA